MALFAQIDAVTGEVLRVVVCDSLAWVQSRLGGTWVETKDADPAQQYAGPGMYQSEVVPRKFCAAWRQPVGSEDAYPVGVWVWHNGQVWENLTPANVQIPGVSGWRDPINEWPSWVQPAGGHDAYPLGAKVTFNGVRYISKISANVWSPMAYPAGWAIQP